LGKARSHVQGDLVVRRLERTIVVRHAIGSPGQAVGSGRSRATCNEDQWNNS
jgi:hypothetical protein